MKHLFAALALCVTTSTQYSEATPIAASTTDNNTTTASVEMPDFSIITIDHARTYVEEIFPYALAIEQQHRVPVPITIAIACLESGYGRSHYAQQRFNHLGIRVYKNGKAGYRTFGSLDECFDYYGSLFTKERYAPLQSIEGNNLEDWVKGLQECGYNNRDKYRKKLLRMINFLHLDQLDYTAQIV